MTHWHIIFINLGDLLAYIPPLLILIFISAAFPQRQFANILYVKYADVILMMGINCLTVKFEFTFYV